MLIEVGLLDESFLQIEFQNFDINSFLNAILIFLQIPDFSGIGVNYIDNDGHYMWLPSEGSFYEIDFYKKLPIIVLFLRIRFFASNILRIYPIESVFQYFLYGVSSLAKLELPKFILDQLIRIKSFVFTGSRSHIEPLIEDDNKINLNILRGLSDSDLTCRGEALLRFLEFLYRLPCFNGHFYEFENTKEEKISLIVILPLGLRRYQVLKRTHEISEDDLIPWKKMRSVFVEDNFLSVEHVQNVLSDGKSRVVTASWLCPSHWHATNLCAEVIHQRLWHLSELKKDASTYKLNESPPEARICRAFELSRWLAKNYPSRPSRWTPARLVGSSRVCVNDSEGVDDKTPRTRRRDARRAAHRSQRGARFTWEEAVEACGDSAHWSASQIARQFLHITGAEAKQISAMVESWRITDRQRLLDTSLSMSEMNALIGANNARKLSLPPSTPPLLPPPPRPPETYRRQTHSRAQTEEPKCETMESSKGSSVRFLGFWKWPDAKKKPQQQGGGRGHYELRNGEPKPQQVATTAASAEEENELLEVAAELKWLILESSRRLTDLCREEERLTGRLPTECIPECKAGHSASPLTVITRSITCHSPVSFPTTSSIAPRSAISAAAAQRKFSDTTISMNESWSLKRIPPMATNRFDSMGSTTISSTMSTSSTLGYQGRHSGPFHHMPPHLIDQKSKVVSRVRQPLRVSASRGVYEMGNWLSELHTNSPQLESKRGAIVSPEACRQSSEPPMAPKMTGYANGVHYSPYQRRHIYRQHLQQQQEQRQDYYHYYRQQDQQKHQRIRQHFHAYEMGDEEAVERFQIELKGRRTPQGSVSVSPQSLLRREKTPGPLQATFTISPHNRGDHSVGARQSCPPCAHSRSAYLDYEEERTRTRSYVSAKRTVVYRAGDRSAVY